MHRIALATALSFALVATAWAGAKDKSSTSLVDINNTGIIDNATAKTKVATTKPCSLQIQMQTVNLPDDAVVICLAEADTLAPPGGNTLILAGEVKAGKVKIKADLTEVDILGQGCGDIDAVTYNPSLRCFPDDAAYRGDANVAGSWRAACPFLESAAPGATKLKSDANATQSVVVGICQGLVVGNRAGPPSTTEFARTGLRSPVILP